MSGSPTSNARAIHSRRRGPGVSSSASGFPENAMSPDELFRPPSPAPVAVGAGLVALDVIMRRGSERQLRPRPGGTCGNVLGILAYLGWMSLPAIRIGADPAAELIVRDLSMRGVSLDLVLQDPSVDTPVIIHKITRTASDGA